MNDYPPPRRGPSLSQQQYQQSRPNNGINQGAPLFQQPNQHQYQQLRPDNGLSQGTPLFQQQHQQSRPNSGIYQGSPPFQQQPQPNNGPVIYIPVSEIEIAPLRIEKRNESITGIFRVIHVPFPNPRPDVSLETSDADISTALWVESTVPRPFIIDVTTSNGFVDLSVHVHSLQGVSINVSSWNGDIRILLPKDFHGLLAISNPGMHTFSFGLRERAVAVALNRPPIMNGNFYQIGGPGGESSAVLLAPNGYVNVGLTGDRTNEWVERLRNGVWNA